MEQLEVEASRVVAATRARHAERTAAREAARELAARLADADEAHEAQRRHDRGRTRTIRGGGAVVALAVAVVAASLFGVPLNEHVAGFAVVAAMVGVALLVTAAYMGGECWELDRFNDQVHDLEGAVDTHGAGFVSALIDKLEEASAGPDGKVTFAMLRDALETADTLNVATGRAPS